MNVIARLQYTNQEWAAFLNAAFPCFSLWETGPFMEPELLICQLPDDIQLDWSNVIASHKFKTGYISRIVAKEHYTVNKAKFTAVYNYTDVIIPLEYISLQTFCAKVYELANIPYKKSKLKIHVGTIERGSDSCFNQNFLVNYYKRTFAGIPVFIKEIKIQTNKQTTIYETKCTN